MAFPRFLGALVVLAGAGYLADSFGTILVPYYSLTISIFTFAGEALLIFPPLLAGHERSHASTRTSE